MSFTDIQSYALENIQNKREKDLDDEDFITISEYLVVRIKHSLKNTCFVVLTSDFEKGIGKSDVKKVLERGFSIDIFEVVLLSKTECIIDFMIL